MERRTLTQQELKELVHYDPETGIFTWLVDRGTNKTKGRVFGRLHNKGYLKGTIDGKQYLLHRLAFLYMEGHFPPKMVDHINRNRTDNRWINLRHATVADNNKNAGQRHEGVYFEKQKNRWRSRGAWIDGGKHLGFFTTHLAACYARHAYDIGVH